jgi:F-type H+-transporting ATPase subunit delta
MRARCSDSPTRPARRPQIRGELAQIGVAVRVRSRACRNALFRPLHPVAERRAVLRSVCERLSLSPILRNFLRLRDRSAAPRRLRRDPRRVRCARRRGAGLVKARVTAAAPLDDAQRARLQRALAARTGPQRRARASRRPALIGGVVATVGNVVFDGSLRTQLAQLRDTLSRGQ